MRASNCFLFLDSPNVGQIGHAYVVSTHAPIPAEAHLRAIANQARGKEPQIGFVAVTRDVVQHDTTRTGYELLICAGAYPEEQGDIVAIREVLAELLATHVSPAHLRSELLQKQGGLVFSAPCLDQITEAFRAEPRIQRIRWMAVSAETVLLDEASAFQSRREGNPKKNTLKKGHLRFLVFMFFVIVIGAVLCFQLLNGSKEPTSGNNPQSNAIAEGKKFNGLDEWLFLDTADWQRLMKETDGAEAMTALKAAHEKGLENVPDQEAEKVLKLLRTWVEIFLSEFPSETTKSGKADAGSIGHSNSAEILMRAKRQEGDKETHDIHGWMTDYKNQREGYSPEIRQKAETLDEFAKAFPSLQAKDIPLKLRTIWAAMDTFRRDEIDHEMEPFRGILQGNMDGVNAPPKDYNILTFQDAERVDRLQRVLSSKEIGLLLIGEEYRGTCSDWSKIIVRLKTKRGLDAADRAQLLIAAFQSLAASPKK